jgi:predicted MFS family arabinose efflux permease
MLESMSRRAAGRPERPYRELFGGNRDFRRLWTAQLISLGGDWFNVVALTGLALKLTGSAAYGGAVLAAGFLPQFVAAPLAGVIADRLDRRRVMLAADLAGACLALTLLAVRSAGTVWLGLAAMAGLAVTGAVFDPASRAGLPNVVAPERLGPATVLMGSTWGVMAAVGAAAGGLAAAVIGRDAAFVVNAASFVVSAGLILRVRSPLGPVAPTGPAGPTRAAGTRAAARRPGPELREAAAWARSDPRVVALLGQKLGYGLGTGMIGLLPLFATRVFAAGDAGIGLLYAARGLGTLLGPFAARAYVRGHTHRLFPAITVAMAVFGLSYLTFPSAPGIWVAAAIVLVAHLGGGTQNTMTGYGLQALAPDRLRGRILAFELGLITAAMGASLLAAGWAAEHAGARLVVEVLGIMVAAFSLMWGTATRRLWRPGATSGTSVQHANEPTFTPRAAEVPCLVKRGPTEADNRQCYGDVGVDPTGASDPR